MSRLLRYIPDTDMRCRHDGLLEHARRNGVRREDLSPGDLLAFINTSADRIMVFGMTDEKDGFGVLGYYRAPHGRIEPRSIQFIPQVFGGGRLDMDRATEMAVEKMIEASRQRKRDAARARREGKPKSKKKRKKSK